MLADDIVLVGENLEEINNRLDEWRLALEGKGLRIRRSKTEYIALSILNKCTQSMSLKKETKRLMGLGEQ